MSHELVGRCEGGGLEFFVGGGGDGVEDVSAAVVGVPPFPNHILLHKHQHTLNLIPSLPTSRLTLLHHLINFLLIHSILSRVLVLNLLPRSIREEDIVTDHVEVGSEDLEKLVELLSLLFVPFSGFDGFDSPGLAGDPFGWVGGDLVLGPDDFSGLDEIGSEEWLWGF